MKDYKKEMRKKVCKEKKEVENKTQNKIEHGRKKE